MNLDLKGLGISLCVKYVLPYLKKIASSAISTLGKNLYERLYKRFDSALASFEEALAKANETTDEKKLKKRIICCELGLNFFEKIYRVLEDVIPNYAAALTQAKENYSRITGKEIGGE